MFYILLMQSKSVILFTLITQLSIIFLLCRYNIRAPGGLTSWEEETFETDIIIPIRLRYITAINGCTVMYSICQVVCPSYVSPAMYSEQFHLDPHVQRRSMNTSLIVLHTIYHGVLTSVYSYRVIHAMRTWLSYSFDDFKDERLHKKLQEFLKIVQMWVNHLKFSFM